MLIEVVAIRLWKSGGLRLLRSAPPCSLHVRVGSERSFSVTLPKRDACRVGLVFDTAAAGEPALVLEFKQETLELPVPYGTSTLKIAGRKVRGEVLVKLSDCDYFSSYEKARVPEADFIRFSSGVTMGSDSSTRILYNGMTYTVDQEHMETTDYAPILRNEVIGHAHSKARQGKVPNAENQGTAEYAFVRKLRRFRSSPEMFITLFSHVNVEVRREDVLRSFFNIFRDPAMKNQLKKRISIRFLGELGEDFGALRKEFFEICARQLVQDERFCLEHGLLDFTPAAELAELRSGVGVGLEASLSAGTYSAPAPSTTPARQQSLAVDDAAFYSFVGFFIGHAVFQQVQISTRFSTTFYRALLRTPASEADIADPTTRSSIEWIRQNDVSELGFVFANGAAVTNENKDRFVQEMVHEEVYGKRPGYPAMAKAFSAIVVKEVSQFTPQELARLLSGVATVPLNYLKQNTIYKKCSAATKEVGFFWEVLEEGSEAFRRQVLCFITGTSSVQYLPHTVNESIIIEKVHETDRLPTAHACFRRLVLYSYPSKEVLRAKLELAVTETAGFHFV